jgi:type IV secretory pathway VirJ component
MTMNLTLRRGGLAVTLLAVLGAAGVTRAAAPGAAPAAKPAAKAAAKTASKTAVVRPSTQINFGRFGAVTIYRPTGPAKSMVIFFSGDGGWNEGVVEMAGYLVDEGAIVAGVDTPHYLDALGGAGDQCVYLAGDVEALGHGLQRQLGLSEYLMPILVGYSSGANVVYATLVQSPPGTFAGGMSLGFCADQSYRGARLCPATGLEFTHNEHGDDVFSPAPHLKDKWIAFQGQKDEVCNATTADRFTAAMPQSELIRLPLVGHGFSVARNWVPQYKAAYGTLLQQAAPPPAAAPEVEDLPLTEVPVPPATAGAKPVADRPAFALLLTGDGGWAGLDQGVSAELAAKGLPVVGLNTLRYFWSARTPEATTDDIARVLRHYLRTWNKEQVVLVGYSFGADVLPFVVSRLPPDLRSRIESLNLIGLSPNASFEINVAGWLPGSSSGDRPVVPELAKDRGLLTRCFYGEGESDTACPGLADAEALRVGTGHHLGGRYGEIADDILASR